MRWMRMIGRSRSGGSVRNGRYTFLFAVLRGNSRHEFFLALCIASSRFRALILESVSSIIAEL